MPPRRARAYVIATSLAAHACDRAARTDDAMSAPSASTAGPLLDAPEDEAPSQDAGQQKGSVQAAGERVSIPRGRFRAGSTPGDRGRDPALEPAMLAVELGAFEIDRLAYPNDPALPATTGVTRDRAAALCQERGARLCGELEWERACKGPEETSYAGSAVYHHACAKEPSTCASGFGALAMAAAMREWTASDVQPIKKWQAAAAAVRGSRADAADVDHRCAHRGAVAPDASADDLGFRCCWGAPSSAIIPSPDWDAAFARADMPAERLEKLFAGNPRLGAVSKDVKYFREEAAIDTVMRRGAARGVDGGTAPPGIEMSTSPLAWNPVPGERILLVTGQSGESSFIVAFHVLSDDRYRVGAAMILAGELGPIVLMYDKSNRQQLHWASCFECYGETGNISYRAENRVTITQK